jgi:hypothetical protein
VNPYFDSQPVKHHGRCIGQMMIRRHPPTPGLREGALEFIRKQDLENVVLDAVQAAREAFAWDLRIAFEVDEGTAGDKPELWMKLLVPATWRTERALKAMEKLDDHWFEQLRTNPHFHRIGIEWLEEP